MTYCANCGVKIQTEDNFCSKCGVRTAKGVETNTPTPSDEMRQAFAKMSTEIEKAFAVAAKEIQEAFRTAGQNVRQSAKKMPTECTSCGAENPAGSVFCFKCGKRIEPQKERD